MNSGKRISDFGGEKKMTRLHRAIQQHGAPLLGMAVYFYDPIFLEIGARMGFRVAWIEMEHAFISVAEAADLCRIASGLGMLTMIRIPDARRESVLKAAECGPDIIDLPMANSPEMLQELVQSARFPPDGQRGFFSVSRAVHYGLVDSVPAEQQKLNDELCLMVQIETADAVVRAQELCCTPGVHVFIGPADLSASLGVPGQTGHPKVTEAAEQTIRIAKQNGKLVAVGAAPQDFPFWVSQGVDVLFCTNDIACLKIGMQSVLQQASAAIAGVERKKNAGRAVR